MKRATSNDIAFYSLFITFLYGARVTKWLKRRGRKNNYSRMEDDAEQPVEEEEADEDLHQKQLDKSKNGSFSKIFEGQTAPPNTPVTVMSNEETEEEEETNDNETETIGGSLPTDFYTNNTSTNRG